VGALRRALGGSSEGGEQSRCFSSDRPTLLAMEGARVMWSSTRWIMVAAAALVAVVIVLLAVYSGGGGGGGTGGGGY
jgi:hypothetical protein